MQGMNVMLKGLELVKAIEPGPFNWAKVIDESYLPADERSQ
jgi:NitT/TauT family transport system substrate-binding protein